jgi:Xaa-Pro aminopeptidase
MLTASTISKVVSRLVTSKRCYTVGPSITATLTGQPFPKSHSHLFSNKSNDDAIAVGGFNRDDFMQRRIRFASKMRSNSIAFVQSSDRHMMTNDIPYPYRQNNDFYYLTGFNEPGACLIIQKSRNDEVHFKLFVRPKHDYREKWDGPRTGVAKAQEYLGIDTDVDKNAQNYLKSGGFSFIYVEPALAQFNTPDDNNHEIRQQIGQHARSNNVTIMSQRHIMDELRKIKDSKDVAMLDKAALISSHAFKAAMVATKPGISEAHIEAVLEFEARLRGAQRLSYPPVVAGGNRASIIHYVLNNQTLSKDDLVLVDAGSEYHNYSSDITRTWPVSGRFTKSQKIVYEAVLRIQESCIRELSNGSLRSLKELQDFSVQQTKEEIQNFGGFTLFGTQIQAVTELLYPHSIGHPMGMDIHEDFSHNEAFKPGMVVTVEPGIYIPNELRDDKRIPSLWGDHGLFGIGVRIEDDVLITKNGARVLTRDTPKAMDEIEYLMNSGTSEYEYLKNHVRQHANF